MLQIGGHHVAYNLTFNGGREGATPLFFGSEPIYFNMGDTDYEPLATQSAAMSNLARALANHRRSETLGHVHRCRERRGRRARSGTVAHRRHGHRISDCRIPPATTDRGILYSALSPDEQALVRTALESYASLPGAAITQPLVAAYESPAALAETYVGYSGQPDLSAEGSYVRIDGPRIWMELVVQRAVADRTKLHYHALWRDKQSDYGGEIGAK